MLYNIFLSVIISIIIIIIIHYLFLFFKDTLTVPIVKDMVVKPTQTYNYLETISNQPTNHFNEPTNHFNEPNEPNEPNGPNELNELTDSNNMKLELKHYLNDLNYKQIGFDNQLNTKLYNEIR